MTRAPLTFFFVLVTTLLVVAPPSAAQAQQEEAQLLFERGNQHLIRGMGARGALRRRELQSALDAYLGVLRLGARTRNVVFNLALALQELGREAEAFNYYSQYLREFELSAEDRQAGTERIEVIRPRVAVATVTSTPPGAEVRVDRRDLPVRGTTPLELALDAGEHTFFFSMDGFEDASERGSFSVGRAVQVSATLVGEPVSVQFIAPSGGRLTLDGDEIDAGRAIPVRPGPHVVRLELPNAPPVERGFEIQPGGEPMAINLSGAGPGSARVAIAVDVEAEAYLDGMPIGRGQRIEFPALPGDHLLRVEADGRNRLEHRFSLQADQTVSLEVSMGQHVESGGLDAGRWLSISFAVAGLASASITTAVAFDRRDRFTQRLDNQPNDGSLEEELVGLADEVESTALAADILWGIGGLASGVAILLLVIDPGDDTESTIQVAAAPAHGGGMLSVRGSF